MKKIVFLLLIMVLTVVCIPVHAKSNFYADQNLKLNKEYNSTIFAAGNNVTATGKVDGISFIAGNDISVENEKDYLFVAGNQINIKNVTTKDAFIAGSSINIEESKIRDLYASADTINISSEISGKAYLGGNIVTIDSTIKGDVRVDAGTIKLGENANIEGTLKYPEGVEIEKADSAKINKEKAYKVETESKTDIAKDMLRDFTTSVLSMILIGLVLLALNKKAFDKIEKIDKKAGSIAKTALLGFATLVLVPIVAIILIISTIGLGLGVISVLLYGIMIYISVIPTAYFVGNWILKDRVSNKYLIFIISILVIYVLKLIPVIGGLVSFVSLCFGLGVYINLIKENITSK